MTAGFRGGLEFFALRVAQREQNDKYPHTQQRPRNDQRDQHLLFYFGAHRGAALGTVLDVGFASAAFAGGKEERRNGHAIRLDDLGSGGRRGGDRSQRHGTAQDGSAHVTGSMEGSVGDVALAPALAQDLLARAPDSVRRLFAGE